MLSDERAPRSRFALFSSSPITALVSIIDSFTGNEVSGLNITDVDSAITLASACGGTAFAMATNPDSFTTPNDFGVDCVTGLRWEFPAGGPTSIGPPTGSITVLSIADHWADQLTAPPGTQWQTHIPDVGAQMALASGSPVAIDAANNVFPLGAGTSLYVYSRTLTNPNISYVIPFVATTNADNELRFEFRRADANNLVALVYNPTIPAFVILQRAGGVQTILGTQSFDLTTLGATGSAFNISVAGANVTIANTDAILVGTFVTTVLSAGQFATFFNATGPGNTGFNGSTNALSATP